jgi:hypothetical protein
MFLQMSLIVCSPSNVEIADFECGLMLIVHIIDTIVVYHFFMSRSRSRKFSFVAFLKGILGLIHFTLSYYLDTLYF